ncbi:MAG: cysteine desulfurase [Anaerolineae bacterium]|nr:cysteine desulfurase [Anaerolineae bacterium]
MRKSIYLDHAATTPTDPRVVDAMMPFFSDVYGNPSSTHSFGRKAEKAVENARQTIAGILNCERKEIVFTSCGTESDNMALRSVATEAKLNGKRAHLLTDHAEHHAISHTAAQLERTMDTRLTWLEVTSDGTILPETLKTSLGDGADNNTLVSILYANNEVGTIQPIPALAQTTHSAGALFHTDAVQAAGQLSLDVKQLGVDMLSLTAHKFYGPKGVGLLYIRDGLALLPAQTGGGQEADRRAGTHNVPLIVGMAKALELAYADLQDRVTHYRHLRDRLIAGVLATVPGAKLSGAEPDRRLPNHASFVIDGIDANALLMHLDLNGVAASSGSACNTGNPEPSDVLLSMGCSPSLALGSLRLTVGRGTSDADIDYVLSILPEAVERVRKVREAQGV